MNRIMHYEPFQNFFYKYQSVVLKIFANFLAFQTSLKTFSTRLSNIFKEYLGYDIQRVDKYQYHKVIMQKYGRQN